MRKINFISILFIATACLAQLTDTLRHYDDEIINITEDNFHQMDANIYNDKIVWIDLRHNEQEEWRYNLVLHQPLISDIYLYNISTSQTQRLTDSKTWKVGPQLSENYLLWIEWENQNEFENEKTILKNLNTGEETVLNDGWGHRLLPNDQILFINDGIYLTDIAAKSTALLRERESGHYSRMSCPDLSGNYLIWLQDSWTNGIVGMNIHALNISTRQEKVISAYKQSGHLPRVYEDRIIWIRENDQRNYELCSKLFYEDNITTIVSSEYQPMCPYINDKYITYVNGNIGLTGAYDILDLNTGNTTHILAFPSLHPYRGLRISGNRVVWVDGSDVKYYQIPNEVLDR